MTDATPTANAARIATLNDHCRTMLGANHGGLILLAGVVALPTPVKHAILDRLRHFTAFPADDPFAEHDHGTFRYACCAIEWRIDYFDPTRTAESADPADPLLTMRVLTVGLDDEFPPF